MLAGLLVSVPASASATTITVAPSSATAPAGTIVKIVATALNANNVPVAGAAVSWTSDFGSIVASDAKTDAAGKARAIVRGWDEGINEVTAWLGVPSGFCEDATCAVATIDWTKSHATCGAGAFALGIGALQLPAMPYSEGMCGDNDDYDAIYEDGTLRALHAERFFEFGRQKAEASVADLNVWTAIPVGGYVGPVDYSGYQDLLVTVVAAQSEAWCAGELAQSKASAALIRIVYDEQVVYEGRPTPGTVVTIPGVGTATLIESIGPTRTENNRRIQHAINAVHIKLSNGTSIILGRAETSIRCVGNPFHTVLVTGGDAHVDSDTGPVHLAFGATGETSTGGAPPFVGKVLQFTDGRADPPGTTATVPFTCYAGSIDTLTSIATTQGGHAAARMTGSITCKELPNGVTQSLKYTLDVEDISFFGPPDYFSITLRNASNTVLYTYADLTDDGSIFVGQS